MSREKGRKAAEFPDRRNRWCRIQRRFRLLWRRRFYLSLISSAPVRAPKLFQHSLLLILLAAAILDGQAFWLRNNRTHSELEWQVIKTAHFHVYYHTGLDEIAQRSALIAEQVYRPVLDQLGMPDIAVSDLILTSEDEISNGFALPGNKMFIWVNQNRVAGRFTGSEKWLRAVIAHEFQHIALINALQPSYGALNLVTMPAWFIEGAAEYYTERWRVGRSDARVKYQIYRNRMGAIRPHDAGFSRVLYLAESQGDSTLRRIIHYRDSLQVGPLRVPLPYRFNSAFRKSTGMKTGTFLADWRKAMRTYYFTLRGQRPSIDSSGSTFCVPGMKDIFGLAVSPDSSKIAVIGRRDRDLRDLVLVVIGTDSTHDQQIMDYGMFAGNPAWSPDGTQLAVSKFHRGRYGSLVWDIRRYSPHGRRPEWVTGMGSAEDPIWSPDGRSILYVHHPDGAANLVVLELASGLKRKLTHFTGDIQIQAPAWSEATEQIVFAIQDESGNSDIALIHADGTGYVKLTNDPMVDLNPLWDPRDGLVIFTSYRSGTPNLYRIGLHGGEPQAITNSAEGLVAVQVVPGTDHVLALANTEIDSLRVRTIDSKLPAEIAPLVILDRYAGWRTAGPEPRIQAINYDAPIQVSQPVSYRALPTMKRLAAFVLPTPWDLVAAGLWSDALGKDILAFSGSVRWDGSGYGGVVTYLNTHFRPISSLTGYKDARWSVRGYGDGYLIEAVDGVDLRLKFPLNISSRLATLNELSVAVQLQRRSPVFAGAGDETAIQGEPVSATEQGLIIAYQFKSQRPNRKAGYFPRQGGGVRATYSSFAVTRPDEGNYQLLFAQGFLHQRIPRTPVVLSLRGMGTQVWGDPLNQMKTGLFAESIIHFNPATLLGEIAPFITSQQLHYLRGLKQSYIGERVLSGTGEIRLPLGSGVPIKFFGVGLGQFSLAGFLDTGRVWDETNWLQTWGGELRGNITLGDLGIVTLARGAATRTDDPHGPLESYFQLAVLQPF